MKWLGALKNQHRSKMDGARYPNHSIASETLKKILLRTTPGNCVSKTAEYKRNTRKMETARANSIRNTRGKRLYNERGKAGKVERPDDRTVNRQDTRYNLLLHRVPPSSII
uniref:Uncharacterized protein n=1 Tax=Cacopsylla melanoneura TaxID=428564 RepID=A0A8D9EBV1_9HEMI